ncbi:MAG: sugar nucleotide-binding protein, partial [Bacteroidota bacterium]
DFARETLKSKYKDCTVNPVTSEEFPTPAKRPNYSVLNKKKIKDTFGLKIRHWQEALVDFLEKNES